MRATRPAALRRFHFWFRMALFDPIEIARKYRALPHFIRNWRAYRRRNGSAGFAITWRDLWYRSQDRYDAAGAARGHYFFQDLWAAKQLFGRGVRAHVDVGSRMDGFVAHVLTFSNLRYVDIRDSRLQWPGFEFVPGSVTELPFANGSVASLSCLHVLEHIGLGRYGDPVDPEGYLAGARELARVLAPGGVLLVGTPVGRERLCFDAHRVFDPQTVRHAFAELTLDSFALIDDSGDGIVDDAQFVRARQCEYGCGLFVFSKKATTA